MNNTTFGNDRFTYYETIGGGQGACPTGDGPSAVHVTMSNALNTPIEALELAYPLRVRRYALRLGSGGAGRYAGGDGVIREIEALEPCRLSLLTERRAHAPAGRRGGLPGLPGRNLLNGEELPAKVTRAHRSRGRPPHRDAGRRRLRRADPARRRPVTRRLSTRSTRAVRRSIDAAGSHDQARRRVRAPLAELDPRPQGAGPAVVRHEPCRARARGRDPRARRGRTRSGGGVRHPERVTDARRRRRGVSGTRGHVCPDRSRVDAVRAQRLGLGRARADRLGADVERLPSPWTGRSRPQRVAPSSASSACFRSRPPA